jgi:hypothetical protein
VISNLEQQLNQAITAGFAPVNKELESITALRARWRSDDMIRLQKVMEALEKVKN